MKYFKNKWVLISFSLFSLWTVVGVNLSFIAIFVSKANKSIDQKSDAEKTFDKIEDEYNTTKADLFLGEAGFSLDEVIAESDLGIISLAKFGGTKITLKLIEMNEYEGHLSIEAIVSNGNYTHVKTFQVKKFLNERVYYTSKADQSLNGIETEVWLTTDLNVEAAPVKTENWNAIGLQAPTHIFEDFLAELTKVGTNNSDQGKLTYQLTLSKTMTNQQVFRRNLNINLHGYKTTNPDVNYMNSALLQTGGQMRSKLNDQNVSDVFNKDTDDNYSKDEIGLIYTDTRFDNFNITFKKSSINSIFGFADGTLTIEYNGASTSRKMRITGYQIQDVTDLEFVASQISTQNITTKTTSQAASVGSIGGNTTFANLGINPPHDLRNASIRLIVSEIVNEIGLVRIEATISKNNSQTKKEFGVSGFAIPGESDVNFVLGEINDTNTIHRNLYASDVIYGKIVISASDLGITNPSITLGTTITYINPTAIDADGEVIVEVIVKKNAIEKTKTIKISGFKKR